jgi:opacity protein-like surface antigen
MSRKIKLRIFSLVIFVFVALLCCSLIIPGALAEEKFERSGFWGGLNIGIGFVQQSFEGASEDGNHFYLGFEGGYTLNPHFLIGVELSGWLIEPGNLNDPSKGEGIMQAFLITRYYPSTTMGLFAKVGGGYVDHWSNHPGEPSSKNRRGLTFGGGYDFPINKNLAITPFINYSFWEMDDQNHDAWTLGIGFTMQ